MKQLILKSLYVFFAVLLFSIQAIAFTLKASSTINRSEIISVSEFDDTEIYEAFAGISELDQYLSINNGKTYFEVSLDNSALLCQISSTTSLPLNNPSGKLALGIPSFLWGCLFNWAGLIIVYLGTDKDKGQTKKALWGCIANEVAIVAYVMITFISAYP
jgi:hypothetical protein